MDNLIKDISKVLKEIRAGDIMSVFATIYGVILVGAVILISQKNGLLGLFMCVFSPLLILVLTVITRIGLEKIKKYFDESDEQTKTTKIVHPKFVRRQYHVEYKVNANVVDARKKVVDFYNKSNYTIENAGIRYITKFAQVITQSESDVLQEQGIVVGGIRVDETKKGHSVAGMNLYRGFENQIHVDKMFYVSFSPGNDKVSTINFDADDQDIALFSEDLLVELKSIYSVKVLETNIKIRSHLKQK
jgi:hypothetical protein